MMTSARKTKLWDEMLTWIYDHCETDDDFEFALDCMGFTRTEIIETIKEFNVE